MYNYLCINLMYYEYTKIIFIIMYYIIIYEVHSACMNQCSSLCINDDLLLNLTVACFLNQQLVYTFSKLSSRAAAPF